MKVEIILQENRLSSTKKPIDKWQSPWYNKAKIRNKEEIKND